MAFAVDDIVQLAPADKKHPTTLGNGFGRILDVGIDHGLGKVYHVSVGGIPGFVFRMEESDLVAASGPTGGRVSASLPPKKK